MGLWPFHFHHHLSKYINKLFTLLIMYYFIFLFNRSHSWRDFTVTVKDSIFVGTTSGFDCSSSPPITHNTSPANWPRGTPVRNAGIVFSSFGSSGIGFGKPWYKPKSYNAIRGQTVIDVS